MDDDVTVPSNDLNVKRVIREWLVEYKSLPSSSSDEYSANIMNKESEIYAIHLAFSSSSTNDLELLELVQSVCHQLFEFYRSGYKNLKLFTICTFPSAVGAFFNVFTSCDELSQFAVSLSTFLLSIYNLLCSTIEENRQNLLFTEDGIEIPSINQSSVFHDSMTFPFSERTLSLPKLNSNEVYVKLPTLTQHLSVTPSNRNKIIHIIMSHYLDNIAFVTSSSLFYLCEICTNLSCRGFPWQQIMLKTERTANDRRIEMAPEVSLVLLRSLYFALYNGHKAAAIKAVQSLQKRARYELSSQVLLLSNAILNSAYYEKARLNSDNPLGVYCATTPLMSRSSSRLLKTAVTAKSIKLHKWTHVNEEVSGDYTKSIQTIPDTVTSPAPSVAVTDQEDSGKHSEKTLSPAKLLKSKIRKGVPHPSTSSPSEKPRSLAIHGNEKKNKKSQNSSKGVDEQNQQLRSRTPSGGQGVADSSLQKSSKVSSTSVPSLKQLTEDEKKKYERSNSIELSNSSQEVVEIKSSDNSSHSSKKMKSKKQNHKSPKDSEAKELLRSSGNSKSKLEIDAPESSENLPLLISSRRASADAKLSLTTTL